MQVRQQAETITEYREELARLESHILVDVDYVNMLVLMFRLEEGVWAGGQGCPILDHRFLNSSTVPNIFHLLSHQKARTAGPGEPT